MEQQVTDISNSNIFLKNIINRTEITFFWHSEDRASWYILIIKPTRCTNFTCHKVWSLSTTMQPHTVHTRPKRSCRCFNDNFWTFHSAVQTLPHWITLCWASKRCKGGHRFHGNEDMNMTVHEWYWMQETNSYSNRIRKLVPTLAKCINVFRDYTEKTIIIQQTIWAIFHAVTTSHLILWCQLSYLLNTVCIKK